MVRKHIGPALCFLAWGILLFWAVKATNPLPRSKTVFFSVIAGKPDRAVLPVDQTPYANEVWMQPMVSPAMSFQHTKGQAELAAGTQLGCQISTAIHQLPGHNYSSIILKCEGGEEFELTGVDFGADYK